MRLWAPFSISLCNTSISYPEAAYQSIIVLSALSFFNLEASACIFIDKSHTLFPICQAALLSSS